MKFSTATKIVLCMLVVGFSSCARVMVPPKVDLKPYEVIGVVDFETSTEGRLSSYATRQFIEAMRRDQGMLRILELGTEDELLAEAGSERMDGEALRQIASKHGVETVITGELVISDVRPEITITPGFGYVSFAAEVDARLDVRMAEAASGASIWSTAATATRRVGHVSLLGGRNFSFDAENPEESYGKLVEALVEQSTRDFRNSWRCKCCR